MKRLLHWLVYLVGRTLLCVVQAMPIEACESIAELIGWLASDVLRLRAGVTDENLRHAYPDWTVAQRRRCARRMWRHLVLMVFEVAYVQRKLHDTNFDRYVRFHRQADLIRLMCDPRPVVLVTGHFGNFEVAGYLGGLFGFPSYTIARPFDNPFLDRFLNRWRGATGQFILPKDGSAMMVDAVLQAGSTLAVLGDQHAGAKGCWVEFLGRPASCHKALALFTLVSGAPQVVVSVRRTGRPMHFELAFHDVIDPRADTSDVTDSVKSLTIWYNRRLEELVRATPDQYWWLHRRWKGEPPEKARRGLRAA